MLTAQGAERDTAITPSRESEGMMAACPALLCYQSIALRNCQAETAFWTSRASSSCPCSLYAPRIRSRA
jgi:hypothetical protein